MNKVVEVQVLLTKMRKFFLRIINNAVKNEVLTSMHGLYLVALNDGEKTKGEMTKLLGFDKANTTRMVDELESYGYVTKTIGKKSNTNLYALSQKGKESALKIESALNEGLSKLTGNIDEGEQEIFRNVCLKIIQNLDDDGKRKE